MARFGTPPFVQDKIDRLIERRLGFSKRNKKTVLGASPVSGTVNAYDPGKDPSLVQQAFAQGLQYAPDALTAGIQAGMQQPNFGRGLMAGLASGMGAVTAGQKEAQMLQLQKGYKERELAAEEKKAEASMITAKRPPREYRTRYSDLTDTHQFLTDPSPDGLGMTEQEAKDFMVKNGLTGRSGAGRGGMGTNQSRLADSLFNTGKAKSPEEATIMAATMLQHPQAVGSISRVIVDPETFSSTTVHQMVYSGINPHTGSRELFDEQGNILTPSDMNSFQGGDIVHGSGGRAGQAPAPPPPPAPPAPIAPVPSHAVGPGMAPVAAHAAAPAPQAPVRSDFVGVGTHTEDQVLQLLQQADPVADRGVIQAYAAGKGALGNSTAIKSMALQKLSQTPTGG